MNGHGRATRIVHTAFTFQAGDPGKLVPDLLISAQAPQPLNGNPPEPPDLTALALADADGETHVYLFDAPGKQRLLQQLAGGLVLAERLLR